jgi:O-methyltransferase
MATVLVYDRMPHMFTPRQLAFLASQLDSLSEIPGAIVEVGCAYGATTVWLRRHMEDINLHRAYICIDTFAGFTAGDISYEQEHRGHRNDDYRDFRANSQRRFKRTLRMNGIANVEVHKCDVADFDFRVVAPIAFCLMDVDLYKPTSSALPRAWEMLSPGGTIVVDDCDLDEPRFDGAATAYTEFTNAIGLPRMIALKKLGLVRKPAESPPTARGW